MTARDFSSISPSAKSLLMLKAQTSLPYARRAAELLWGVGAVLTAERETLITKGGAGRRRHFELRAHSIDEAIQRHKATRILELAAGLSFRGLDLATRREDVFYLDTDLSEIVATKLELLEKLQTQSLRGTLLVGALDALDAGAFRAAVADVPKGKLAIVQEGLLMYLDESEKARLAANVQHALKERGGVWITADIYVRSEIQPQRDEQTQAFLEQHRVEENKFASWDAATAFIEANGFRIAERLVPDSDPWPVRQTWVLESAA
jgi:O-methyltransferase involved in polyketide biosynthesis